MSRDAVERLAISVAEQLSGALGHPAKANEHASGYGTVCLTGHPVIESLWLRCVKSQPEAILLDEESDARDMPSIGGVPRLPMVLYRTWDTKSSDDPTLPVLRIHLVTRMWVLDELRWLSQSETDDEPRSLLDTLLSKLNHGNMSVVIHFVDLIRVLKAAVEAVPVNTERGQNEDR